MAMDTQARLTVPPCIEDCPELFEGPEKTLCLCFRARRISAKSLRLIPQEAWERVLEHAKCQILSVIHSSPVELQSKMKKDKAASTKGVTGYLLSESSLFLTDTTLTLKTCGRTTPLAALEPIFDLVVPSWRQRQPESYLQYATLMRLSYMRPGEQLEPHTSWEQEVEHMNKFLIGEDMVLGSEATSKQHIYVANYMPKTEIVDVFSTQVAVTDLDTMESMKRFGCEPSDMKPLQSAWQNIHGDERRSIASNPTIDEYLFEPFGYSSNAVFGKHFTTIHVTPQPGCSYFSIETSMPLTREGRQRFLVGADGFCKGDRMSVTEFSLSPKLFGGGAAADVPGFHLLRSSQSVGSAFACAHHCYARDQVLPPWLGQISPSFSSSTAPYSLPGSPALYASAVPEVASELAGDCTSLLAAPADVQTPVVEVPSTEEAPLHAAQLFLSRCGDIPKDIPISLLDITALRRQAEAWHRLLPRVEPFYAVKCNPHPTIVSTLWDIWQQIGCGGFDCASPSEMQLVLNLTGLKPAEHIVYANPCKQNSAIQFSRDIGVKRVVFDNVVELRKLVSVYPKAELLLRVQTDDSLAQCPLSNKFGAAPADCRELLLQAKELGMKVVGVSFHVGSGCSQPGAFRGALQRARDVYDEAERLGMKFTCLDIGGGFPGWDEQGQATFADHAADICEMLEKLFPSPGIQVIAEPGRYFAATSQALLTTLVSVAESSSGCRYYLNDGVYGSFNCLFYDHATVPQPEILRDGEVFKDQVNELATIFGPTCDGLDLLTDSIMLPRLKVDDKLLFANMGAYTSAASTSFNGFAPAKTFVYQSQTPSERDT
mmetsp:Transcript_56525/g.87937  ORF Transcript_56525/g.87937 Transcript_56525/m.87937 type:complete len:827 (-) Transcript_56525:88-2568(-)